MTIQEESEALELLLSKACDSWKEELDSIDAEIKSLNAILQDKESQTDRSENATFQIAKDTRDVKMSAYAAVYSKIAAYSEYKRDYVPTGAITVGSTVEVKPLSVNGSTDVDQCAHRIIKLVGSNLSDAQNRLVSVDSALGSALLGHRPGEQISIKTRKGLVTYLIERMY